MILPTPLRILIKTAIRLVLVLTFLGIPASLLFLRFVGFGDEIRDRVADALSSGPVEVRIGRLSFDIVEGVVAEEVSLHQAPSRKVARIDRVAVVPNLSELLSGRLIIDRVVLHDADAEIPLGPDLTPLKVGGLRADLQFVENDLRIVFLEALLQGIQIKITGSLQGLRDTEFKSPPATGDSDVAGKILTFLSDLQYPEAQPTLTLAISGSVADPASLAVDSAALRTGPVKAPNWEISSLEASGKLVGREWRVEQFLVRDASGRLRLWATGNQEAAEIQIDSTLSPGTYLDLLPENPLLDDLILHRPPAVVARANISFASPKPKIFVSGSLAVRDFAFRGVKGQTLTSDFAWDGKQFFLRGAELVAAGGQAEIHALFAGGDIRLKGHGSMQPSDFASALDTKTRELLSQMEFADLPSMSFSVRGTSTDFFSMKGSGHLDLGRTAMRGVWIDSAKSDFEVAAGAITYRDFELHGSGKSRGTGSFTYDFAGQQVRIKDIVSSMNPVDVLMWVDPRIAETIRPYRFRANPAVTGEGTIFMKEPNKNNLSLQIESAAGLDYDLFKKTLRLGKTSATVDVMGTTVHAKVRDAELMSGRVRVDARVSIDPKKPVFGADVALEGVDFEQLANLYFGYGGSQGVVSGDFSFNAPLKRPSAMQGSGSVRVQDGNVFAIPLLGPLSEIINKIIPGAGYETARLATADFSVANERIQTSNFEIEGSGFSMFGEGEIFFLTDKMDMSIRINARGVPGIVLFPVSKLFEYISTGTVSQPDWRPKIIPRFGN